MLSYLQSYLWLWYRCRVIRADLWSRGVTCAEFKENGEVCPCLFVFVSWNFEFNFFPTKGVLRECLSPSNSLNYWKLISVPWKGKVGSSLTMYAIIHGTASEKLARIVRIKPGHFPFKQCHLFLGSSNQATKRNVCKHGERSSHYNNFFSTL